MHSLISLLTASLIAFTSSLYAQSAYKGFYTGSTTIEISGAITIPERPVGTAIFTIDENGYIFGNLEGNIDAAGNITWKPNSLGFTTGQVNGSGELTATAVVNNGPTTSTTRIHGQNQAGGFGYDSEALAYKFSRLSPLPTSGNLNDVAYGDGTFVAVGDGGEAAYTGNGIDWFALKIPAGDDLNGVAYGNGKWVVVGDGNLGFVSDDLQTWTAVNIGGVNNTCVTFDGSRFYAGTLNAGIQVSTDGIGWTTAYSGSLKNISSIQYLNGMLVAFISDVSYNVSLLLSSDGNNWTSKGVATGEAGRATYGNGQWVFPFTRKIYRFTTTNASDLAFIDTTYNTNTMGFINGTFVDGDYYTSTDAVSWSQISDLPFTASRTELNAYASGNGILLGVGEGTVVTEDAASFELTSTSPVNTSAVLSSVIKGGNTWLIVGDGVVVTTTDLENWTTTTVTGNQFENVAYGAGMFIATGPGPGAQPVVYRSTDGVNWEIIGSPNTYDFDAIAYGNSRWVAANTKDKSFYYSFNGIDWFKGTSFSGHVIADIEYTNGQFIAVGSTSFLSSNGKSWTGGSGGTGGIMRDVEYANGIYVAVGDNNAISGSPDGRVLTSNDGLSWTNRTVGFLEPLNAVRYVAGTWVVAGNDNTNDHGATILESTDGVTFTFSAMNFANDIKGMEAANGILLAVGGRGSVFYIPYEDTGSPYVIEHPISQSVNEDGTLTLTVEYGGNEPMTVNWLKDGEPLFDNQFISGASTTSLTINNVSPDDAGLYTAILTNNLGSTATDAATVVVNSKPVITAQPESIFSSGGNVEFSVTATDATSYQWYFNGSILPGATSATLSLASVDQTAAGAYYVKVTNTYGTTDSDIATLSLQTGGSAGASLSLDTAFNSNAPALSATASFSAGKVIHEVSEVLVQPDGKIIVTGLFEYTHPTVGTRYNIVRLNTDGTIDSSFAPPTLGFNSSGWKASKINSAALMSDGRIVLGASPTLIGADPATASGGSSNSKRFIMLNADGSWDNTWSLAYNPSQTTIGLAVDDSDRILIASYYVNAGSGQRKVARFLANGSLDTTFSNLSLSYLDQPVDYPFMIQDDGTILVAAYYNNYNKMGVIHLNDDGSFVQTTGEPETQSSWIQRLIPGANGKFYVLGSFDTVDGRPQYGIARTNESGANEFTYAGPDDVGADFWHGAELPDGSFLTVGPITGRGPDSSFGIYRLDAVTGEYISDPVLGAGFGFSPESDFAFGYEYARAVGKDASRNAIYVAGDIKTLNGVSVPQIFKLSYSSGGGIELQPLAIVAQPQDVTAERGDVVSLSVGAIGGNLSFAWYHNDVLMDGETESSISLTLDHYAKAGDYYVVVTDDSGSVASSIATVSFPQSYDEFAASLPAEQQGLLDLNPSSGLPNIHTMAFDAADGDRSKLPAQNVVDGADIGLTPGLKYMLLTYRQSLAASGVELTPRASSELDTLINGARNVIRVGDPVVDDDALIFTYRSLQSVEDAGSIFMDVLISIENQ